MKTPIKDRHEVRTTTMTFPLTVADKQRILEVARSKGLTMSSLVRMIVHEALAKGDK